MDTKPFLTGLCFFLALGGCRDFTGSDPVEPVVRGGMSGIAYVDHTFEAADLGRYEGRRVLIRIGGSEPLFHPHPERVTWGMARIRHGGFRLFFPSAREEGFYKPFVLFIDRDGNGRCTPGKDVGFRGATGGNAHPYVSVVDPQQFHPMQESDCDFYHAALPV